MLHASETWPLTKTNLQRLQRNDRAMIRQICSIKPEDVARVRSRELLAKLQLEDLDLILRERRLRWFGHVERSSGAIRTAYDMQIDGKRGAGRPKQTWKKLTEKDCREWKLTTVDPTYAQSDLRLYWWHKPHCLKSHAAAQIRSVVLSGQKLRSAHLLPHTRTIFKMGCVCVWGGGLPLSYQ